MKMLIGIIAIICRIFLRNSDLVLTFTQQKEDFLCCLIYTKFVQSDCHANYETVQEYTCMILLISKTLLIHQIPLDIAFPKMI